MNENIPDDKGNLPEINSFDTFTNYLSSVSCYRNICITFENSIIV